MSTLRVVSYAINGRGMGHLVRQLAIGRWIKRITALTGHKCELWVLTSSEADTLARREGIPAFKMPSKAMVRDAGLDPTRYLTLARTWVLNTIAGLKPDLLLVDTFAGGSFGELVASLELAKQRVLVARRVREAFAEDDPYQALMPLYQKCIHPDARGSGPIIIRERSELYDREHARAELGAADAERVVYVTLGGGGDVAAGATLPKLCDDLLARGWHVVVGAGPLYQGPERRGPGVTWMTRYCPLELMQGFDAAVSAGGYNSFHELMFAGVPTVFLPQPRIADDQAERTQRAEAAGAGRVAQSIDEVAELLEAPGSADAARKLVPENGARRAALSALSLVMSHADITMADRILTDDVLTSMRAYAGEPKLMELVRLICGEAPSSRARTRAVLLGLSDEGYDVPTIEEDDPTPARVCRMLDMLSASQVPFDSALSLMRALRRKFPADQADDVLTAADELFACWAGHQDWMGAVSLMRAVSTQRGYPVKRFAADMCRWLATQEDLFDALRELTRSEGSELSTVLSALAPERGAAQ